jgi:ABC-type phosphate/phosphonate transport system substrate-binding protein
MRIFTRIILLWSFASLSQLSMAQQELIFSTAPTHSQEVTLKLYTPLVNYLSQVTGQRIVLRPAINFVDYASGMQNDRYDILFDGPHLAGWRIEKRDHEALARLPGQIRFAIIGREDSSIQSMQELALGRDGVCAFASPNMLTLAFLSHFPHPARQPNLLRTQGFPELVECLRSGKGDVAIIRDSQWNGMDQTGLKIIEIPQESYPERSFTISRKVDPKLREQIREALLSEEGKQAMAEMLKTFNREQLIPVRQEEYAGLGALLVPVWGFH